MGRGKVGTVGGEATANYCKKKKRAKEKIERGVGRSEPSVTKIPQTTSKKRKASGRKKGRERERKREEREIGKVQKKTHLKQQKCGRKKNWRGMGRSEWSVSRIPQTIVKKRSERIYPKTMWWRFHLLRMRISRVAA